jgi:hypothetical protein
VAVNESPPTKKKIYIPVDLTYKNFIKSSPIMPEKLIVMSTGL